MNLLPEDVEYLDANFPSRWKMVAEGTSKYGLFIEDYTIPKGYHIEKSTLMVLIPSGYPGSGIDMFYFRPGLIKSDGSSIHALVAELHFGRTWQRWSRHYPWQPGESNIVTHIEYIKNQLTFEIRRDSL